MNAVQQLNQDVPAAYLGVWQRRLLTTTQGVHDTTTEVFWLQTARLHADLRLPVPETTEITHDPLSSLAEATPAQQTALASQAGFAGVTRVHNDGQHDICQWHRRIDYQPSSDRADIGTMAFASSERVLEDGLDGGYHEVWERLPDSIGSNWGVWLGAAEQPERQGCLLVAGAYFLFAAARSIVQPVGGRLADHLRSADAQSLLAFELSFGTITDGWTITHSTLPGRAGQRLHTAEVDARQVLPATVIAGLGAYAPVGGWHLTSDPHLPLLQPVSDAEDTP